MAGGRPIKYSSANELQNAVDKYFSEEEKPTLAGLAYELGISRSTLYLYEEKNEFSDIIKKARERVESSYEKRLIYGNNATGVIFALKNMGWRDKTEIESNVSMSVNWQEEKTYVPLNEINN